jgi:maltose alpha-D-glucosyltransferase/alpha-amylase
MSVLEGNGRRELEESVLRGYLARQRWFGAKSRAITGTRIEDWAVFNQGVSALVWSRSNIPKGSATPTWSPWDCSFGKAADALREESPNALLARVTSADEGVLHEAIFNDSASEALLALIARGARFPRERATLVGVPSSALAQLKGEAGTGARGAARRSKATPRLSSATS